MTLPDMPAPRHPLSLTSTRLLHALQHLLLELPVLYLLAGVVGARLAVQREQVAEIKFGCLEQLDLADVDL